MAVPTADDRVYCYACGLVTSSLADLKRWELISKIRELPPFVRDVVFSLITYKVPEDLATLPTYTVESIGQKGLGFSEPMTEGDMARASAAVAQGAADYLIAEAERISINLSHGPHRFHTLKLSYLPSANQAPERVDADEVLTRHAALLDRLQPLEAKAVVDLIRHGFVPGGFDVDSSMRFVRLFSGSAQSGVSAEITWIP